MTLSRSKRTRALIVLALGLAVSMVAARLAWNNQACQYLMKTTQPLHWFYLKYSVWKHGMLTPEEAHEGAGPEQIVLREPMGVTQDTAGRIYLTDRKGFIWRIDHDVSHIIAGSGRHGMTLTDIPARQSDLGVPQAIRVGPDGRVYYAEGGNHMVVAIDDDGAITRIAGRGWPGCDPANQPARESLLFEPHDLCFDPTGVLYVADSLNNRVVRIDLSGNMTVVAGQGGRAGFRGEGGPSQDALLDHPYGITLDNEGRVIIADSGNNRIRRIDADGTIRTIAGSGRQGFAGDGGPALEADFNWPQSILYDILGRLWISDEHNNRIRRVDVSGIVETIAGDGQAESDGNGGLAVEASIIDPEGMCLLSNGSLLFAECKTGYVREVTPDGRIRIFAGKSRN